EFLRNAVGAVDLHRGVDDAPQHLARVELGHRGLDSRILAAVGLPGAVPDEIAARPDLHLGVREHPLDRLALAERRAEGRALLGDRGGGGRAGRGGRRGGGGGRGGAGGGGGRGGGGGSYPFGPARGGGGGGGFSPPAPPPPAPPAAGEASGPARGGGGA